MAEPRLLTASDLASYLSVSPTTLRRMTARGELPEPIHLPGVSRPFWDRAAIDRFLDSLSPAARYDDPDVALERGGADA